MSRFTWSSILPAAQATNSDRDVGSAIELEARVRFKFRIWQLVDVGGEGLGE